MQTDTEWYEHLKAGDDAAWKEVWERVVEPESTSMRSAQLMEKYSITAGDLMGMLYADMIGRQKIDLYRNDGGSLEGWLKSYVRGYVLAANPNQHGEISIDSPGAEGEDSQASWDLPKDDHNVERMEAWNITHLCLRDLWNEDPERAYVHLLKTRFMLSSEEIRDFLDISSASNVDQIFSRGIKFMRHAWDWHDRNG